jgi:hypothetical protein
VLLADRASEPLYTLVLARPEGIGPPVAVDAIRGEVALSCDERAGNVTVRREDATVARWRCGVDGCAHASSRPLSGLTAAAGLVTATTLEDTTLVVWSTPGAGLRLRLAPVAELHERADTLLLDPDGLAQLQPAHLHLIARGRVALLLLHGADRRLYAVRIDAGGKVSAVGANP